MRKQQNQESIDAATAEVKKEGSKKDLGSADNPTPVHSNSHEETGLAFRKKPVVIQAIEVKPVTSSRKHLDAIRDFMGGEERRNIHFGINYSTGEITINTLEGTMKANVGDWIIRGVKGEFYPCKPDIFEATYERVTSKPTPFCDAHQEA